MVKSIHIIACLSIILFHHAGAVQISSLPGDSVGATGIVVVSHIELIGNKVTKPKIIMRELTFSKNDTLSSADLSNRFESSRENLLKTSLFNYVYFDTSEVEGNLIDVTVKLEERWYTWPEIYINHADRNFNSWWRSKDFGRLYYGLGLTRYNFRGRQEKFSLRGIIGFTSLLSAAYDYIYLDKARKHYLDIEVFFENQNRLDYITQGNEIQQFKSDNRIFRKSSYFLRYNYRQKFYTFHTLILGYFDFVVSDTVISLNDNFLGSSRKNTDFSVLSYIFENDHRDLKFYPLKGSYFTFQVSYYGLFNHSINKLEVKTGYHRFFEMHRHLYSSLSVKTQVGNHEKQPYVLTEALGYNDYLRGYENYVIDGQNFFLFKSSLKYEILPTKIITLKFIPFKQFNKIHIAAYMNLFFDAGYVQDQYTEYLLLNNNLVNKAIYTFGAGIDLVTYYDKMLRVDLAHNEIDGWGVYLNLDQHF